MNVFGLHLAFTLRRILRDTQSLVMGFAVPALFLVSFAAVSKGRTELTEHVALALAVAIMGGACTAMPIMLVAERERGVWRRYRLTPQPASLFLGSTLLARFALLVAGGALQLAIAILGYGAAWPGHPLELLAGFLLSCWAFLGVGLTVAALARGIGGASAWGHILFLPLIIVGGAGIPVWKLPMWMRHLSAFLPVRYSVESMRRPLIEEEGFLAAAQQSWVALFPHIALLGIGAAGMIAGVKLFRFDPDQRSEGAPRWVWAALALGAWIAVGVAAEILGVPARRR